jgi:hypothetical protein
MKKFLVVCAVVFSCSAILGCGGAGAGGGGGGGGTTTTQEKKFWAQNASTGANYQLDAELLASNTRCEVWVEKGSTVTEAAARNVASEFNNVYSKLMNTTTGLGWQLNIDGRQTNTMQFADMLGDGNQKLIILLLDIRDGYTNENDPYVAGYFDPVQFFADSTAQTNYNRRSNECDMIYMDINPSVIGPSFYGTLAHEMQHLMNFVTSMLLIGNEIRDSLMDLWIDEGLSAAAEWIYSGQLDESRIAWYGADPTGFIAQGDNFFVWDNYQSLNPSAVLNDYATVNLFFHWLRLNSSDGGGLFKYILFSENSVNYDYKAITGLFTGTPWGEWKTLIEEWHAANFINSPNSRLGYRNANLLNLIKSRYVPVGTTSVNLFPGEGVYSHAPSTNYSGAAPISYSYLTNSEISSTYSGTTNTLLTFNSNSNRLGDEVSGTTTGLVSPANVKASISGSRVAIKPESYRVSAGDMLRRNGHNFNPSSFAPVPNNNTGRSVIIDSKPIPKINAGDLPNVKLTLKD